MIQTLRKNWRLLALYGVAEAAIAALYFTMWDTHGPLTFHSWNAAVRLLGQLALAAAACTIAGGLWRSATGKCWLLVVHGLMLAALGVIPYGLTGYGISFFTIALLMALIAMSLGVLQLRIARTLDRQRHVADAWLLRLAGGISVGFGLAFFGLAGGWLRIEPESHADALWLGSYFGCSALGMLGLALRLRSQNLAEPRRPEPLPPFASPKHAH